MADWKKEIRKLAKDFLIDMEIYHNAVNEASKTQNTCSTVLQRK